MKLKEAPSNRGKKYTEHYSILDRDYNLVIAVDPPKNGDKFTSYTDEDSYIRSLSNYLNALDIILTENSVILLSGFFGDHALETEVNTVWKAVISALKTTPYSIGDVIVWKKSTKTKNERENRLDTICDPIFVLCRKSEYRTYHMNVNERTVKGNAKYHTPVYNIIMTNGRTPEEDHKELIDYLIRMYCPDNGKILYPFEEAPNVQD